MYYLTLLVAASIMGSTQGKSSKVSLEEAVAKAYEDKGLVTERIVSVGSVDYQYLVAGDDNAKATLLFCHGAAFTMNTWKIVGALDMAATHGYRAIALNLPGYGSSSKAKDKKAHLKSFADAIGISHEVVVIAASMGGTYALPFVYAPGKYHIAGLVTAAASLSGLPAGYVIKTPTLAVYGSEDGRLKTDRAFFSESSSSFPASELVVFDDAPHPCYLRDAEAARQFTDLVLTFINREQGGAKNEISLVATWE